MINSKVIVPDTSCLILFLQLNRISLLQEIINGLGKQLVLLTPVIEELRTFPLEHLKKLEFQQYTVENISNYQKQYRIGKGEASILKFAASHEITAIIDDSKARKVAESKSIRVIGTMALFGAGFVICSIKTKEKLAEYLSRAKEIGFRLPSIDLFVSKLEKRLKT